MSTAFMPATSQNETADTGADEIVLLNYPSIMLVGEGDETVYVKFGPKGATVATSEDIPILSGAMIVFTKPIGCEVISILAAQNTSRLGIVQGYHGV